MDLGFNIGSASYIIHMDGIKVPHLKNRGNKFNLIHKCVKWEKKGTHQMLKSRIIHIKEWEKVTFGFEIYTKMSILSILQT